MKPFIKVQGRMQVVKLVLGKKAVSRSPTLYVATDNNRNQQRFPKAPRTFHTMLWEGDTIGQPHKSSVAAPPRH